MESKNVARFLAFDSLKGLKEAISDADDSVSKKSATLLSDDIKEEMDYLINTSYKNGNMIYISYIYKGNIEEIFGSIKKIDYDRHILWTHGGKKIYLAQITRVREP